jgi:hypothetical protein
MDFGSYFIIPTNLERLGIIEQQLRLVSSCSKSMAAFLIPEGSTM